MKKLIAVFMAIAMCMALAVPALAGEAADPTKGEAKYTSEVKKPTVKVTVGTVGKVILNPYQIKFATKDLVGGSATAEINPSVIAPTLLLTNESNVPLKMSIVATGKIDEGSTAKFATAKPADTEKNHAVYLYLVVSDKGELDTAPDVTAAPTVADYDATNTSMGLIKAGELKMTDFLTLKAVTNSKKAYVTVDFGGACATTPTEPWSDKDTVSVDLAFTFQPTVETAPAGGGAGGNG
jgi:hypothetical protein